METKKAMGYVKAMVRRTALHLLRFTVKEMIQATGMKPESVQTVIQRMKEENYLTVENASSNERHERGVVYHVTTDLKKRADLLKEVEAYYPSFAEPSPSASPTSRHYDRLQACLDAATCAKDPTRDALLAEAEELLDYVMQDEGGKLASRSVQAYLRFDWARLEYLEGRVAEATNAFRELRNIFVEFEDSCRSRYIKEFLLSSALGIDFAAEGSPDDAVRLAHSVLSNNDFEKQVVQSPVALNLRQVVVQLTRIIDQKVFLEASWPESKDEAYHGWLPYIPPGLALEPPIIDHSASIPNTEIDTHTKYMRMFVADYVDTISRTNVHLRERVAQKAADKFKLRFGLAGPFDAGIVSSVCENACEYTTFPLDGQRELGVFASEASLYTSQAVRVNRRKDRVSITLDMRAYHKRLRTENRDGQASPVAQWFAQREIATSP